MSLNPSHSGFICPDNLLGPASFFFEAPPHLSGRVNQAISAQLSSSAGPALLKTQDCFPTMAESLVQTSPESYETTNGRGKPWRCGRALT